MKNLKLGGFEIYLVQESLKLYKSLIAKEEFPENAIITKEYVESMIAQLEEKLSEENPKRTLLRRNRNRKLNEQ